VTKEPENIRKRSTSPSSWVKEACIKIHDHNIVIPASTGVYNNKNAVIKTLQANNGTLCIAMAHAY
jgi:hypothetical protein